MSSTDNPCLQEPLAQWGRHCSNRPNKGSNSDQDQTTKERQRSGLSGGGDGCAGMARAGGYVGKGLSRCSDPFSPLPAHCWVSTPRLSPRARSATWAHLLSPTLQNSYPSTPGSSAFCLACVLPAASTAHCLCFAPRGGEEQLSTFPQVLFSSPLFSGLSL